MARIVSWLTPYAQARSRRDSCRARSAIVGQLTGSIRGACCGSDRRSAGGGAATDVTATGAGVGRSGWLTGKYAENTITPGDLLSTGRIELAEVTGLEPAVSALTGQRVNHYTTPPRPEGIIASHYGSVKASRRILSSGRACWTPTSRPTTTVQLSACVARKDSRSATGIRRGRPSATPTHTQTVRARAMRSPGKASPAARTLSAGT